MYMDTFIQSLILYVNTSEGGGVETVLFMKINHIMSHSGLYTVYYEAC